MMEDLLYEFVLCQTNVLIFFLLLRVFLTRVFDGILVGPCAPKLPGLVFRFIMRPSAI